MGDSNESDMGRARVHENNIGLGRQALESRRDRKGCGTPRSQRQHTGRGATSTFRRRRASALASRNRCGLNFLATARERAASGCRLHFPACSLYLQPDPRTAPPCPTMAATSKCAASCHGHGAAQSTRAADESSDRRLLGASCGGLAPYGWYTGP
jgi:hypothetical protein